MLQTDTDVVWLANPYPALKTLYAGQQLVPMSDRPLLNAGVFYAQNIRPGDGAAWVLQVLPPFCYRLLLLHQHHHIQLPVHHRRSLAACTSS